MMMRRPICPTGIWGAAYEKRSHSHGRIDAAAADANGICRAGVADGYRRQHDAYVVSPEGQGAAGAGARTLEKGKFDPVSAAKRRLCAAQNFKGKKRRTYLLR